MKAGVQRSAKAGEHVAVDFHACSAHAEGDAATNRSGLSHAHVQNAAASKWVRIRDLVDSLDRCGTGYVQQSRHQVNSGIFR